MTLDSFRPLFRQTSESSGHEILDVDRHNVWRLLAMFYQSAVRGTGKRRHTLGGDASYEDMILDGE